MGLITDAPDPTPPSRLATWLARTSSRVFAGALVLAMVAVALMLYQQQQQRLFAEPTENAMGVVQSGSGRATPKRRARRVLPCSVSYEFTPPGGTAQRNSRLWPHGCDVSRGRPILIQYVIARPEVNRPAADPASYDSFLIWFAAGVMVVIGTLIRVSRE